MRSLTAVNSIIVIFISSLLISCGGMKVSGASKANKLYEVFYIKNGVTQYFVKPLKLKADGVNFAMDFTIRSDVKRDGNITCNFSTFSKEPIKKIDNLTFKVGNNSISCYDMEKVFLEKVGKKYHLRYTSKLKFSDFSLLTKSSSSTVEANEIQFETPNKVSKKLSKIDEYVVEVIELNFED